MEPEKYLTPKKFLQCCGFEKSKCTEATLGAYLGEAFLNLKIYNEGSSFDTYYISQTEGISTRFFMEPTGRGRRSLPQDKCMDLYDGITDKVLQSVVRSVEGRMLNPALQHPDYEEIMAQIRENQWMIDQEAEADLVSAGDLEDSVGVMILLLASLFQDYYSGSGITRRVRSFLKTTKKYRTETRPQIYLREEVAKTINPVSALKTNQTYVRRQGLLEETEKKLSRLEKMGEKRFLLLYGAPGNGKSELARAYASENMGLRFCKAYWLTCPHGENQITLADLCKNVEPESGGRDIVARLAAASADVLLVVDNCNFEIAGLINELYYHTGEATVLITSRLNNFSGFDDRNALHVYSKDQRQFCLEVFRRNYEKKRITGMRKISEAEMSSVKEICDRVYLNPLFISMVASFLREHGSRITISDFNKNLKSGLLEAFPKYSQLDYRKDEQEPVMLQPQKVLEVILQEELNCIRLFGEEERQIMHLMVLFPAEPLSRTLVGEILGDNKDQLLMDSVMDRLLSISLLQQEGDNIAVHPLVCELILSGVLMDNGSPILYREKEKDAFYSHILEHLFLFEQKKIRSCMHLAHSIFHEIHQPSLELQILFYAYFDRNLCSGKLKEFLDDPAVPHVIACCATEMGSRFLLQDMLTSKTRILLDLSERRNCNRYFGHDTVQVMKQKTSDSTGSNREAVLICFYEGQADEEELLVLDLTKGVAGYPVKVIPDTFMRACTRQFKILFPEGLKKIGDWAFDNCRGMRGPLELPDSIEKIGTGAFHGCNGLNGELKLPENLRVLDDLAFCLCGNLQGPLKLPDSLEELGEMAFSVCDKLEGVVVCPPRLKRAESNAFYNCRGLIPDEKFTLLMQVEKQESDKEGRPLYISPFVEKIENEAYYGGVDLTGELKLPVSVQEIGNQAFYRCGRITGNLQFSGSLKKIGAGAFFGCSGLNGGVDLPDTCSEIGDGAFFGCSGLDEEIRLPRRITNIPSAAFFMCSNIKGIRNLEELTDLQIIKEGAFLGCDSLKGELYFPGNLTEIEDGAFDGCHGLSSLFFSKTNNMKRLGNGCFHNCSGLTGTLHIPISMESVGLGCFYDCRYTTCIVHNRYCELHPDFVGKDVLLIGFQGSTAEAYAEKYGNPFQVLE